MVADNRGGTGTHGAILKHFQKANVELILNLGDMVYPVPGAFSDSSDGYFLIHITPSNGLIELDHFRFTRELKHQHRKTAGEPLPPPSKK